jgi:Flp pilus assembly protein TadG
LIALILLGSIDVGQSIYVAQVVNEASREAARQAARFDTTSEDVVRSTVRNFIRGNFSGMSDAAVDVNFSDSGGDPIASGDLSSISSGSSLSVEVALQYDSVRWMPGIPFFGGRTIATTTIMRRE